MEQPKVTPESPAYMALKDHWESLKNNAGWSPEDGKKFYDTALVFAEENPTFADALQKAVDDEKADPSNPADNNKLGMAARSAMVQYETW